jgi:hypothetical protein
MLGEIVRGKIHTSSPVPVGVSTPFAEAFFAHPFFAARFISEPLKYEVSAWPV